MQFFVTEETFVWIRTLKGSLLFYVILFKKLHLSRISVIQIFSLNLQVLYLCSCAVRFQIHILIPHVPSIRT